MVILLTILTLLILIYIISMAKPLDLNPLELFAARFMVHHLKKEVCKPHRDMCRLLADHDINRVVIEFFRGGGKSTWGSLIYPMWEICEGNYEEIQIFAQSGGTAGLSTKILNKIKREVEGNELVKYYYELQKGEAWGQDHIQIIRGDGFKIDLYSRGKHASARGQRGLIIIDDPQDSDDCRSETVLARDEDWLFSDLLPIMLPEHRLVFIATSISPLSLCSKVQTLENWKTSKFALEDPVGSGKSIWAAQYPDDWIEMRKRESGIERFNAEYNCIPLVSGNPIFKREWLKGYDPDTEQFRRLKRDGFYKVVGGDCAESKRDTADHTAFVTLGVTTGLKPDIYVLDVRRNHWSTKEGAEQVIVLFNQYKQNKTIIESRVKDGDAMIEEIRALERLYGVHVNLYPETPIKDKVMRANRVQSMFQEGRVYFNFSDKFQQALVSELIMFTGEGTFHDDMVDAIVYALSDIKQRESGLRTGTITSAIGDDW